MDNDMITSLNFGFAFVIFDHSTRPAIQTLLRQGLFAAMLRGHCKTANYLSNIGTVLP